MILLRIFVNQRLRQWTAIARPNNELNLLKYLAIVITESKYLYYMISCALFLYNFMRVVQFENVCKVDEVIKMYKYSIPKLNYLLNSCLYISVL